MPICGFSWSQWDTNLVGIYRDWSILSFCAKWEDRPAEVFTIDPPKSLRHFLENPRNDYKLVRHLWRLLDECKILVAHNLLAFDEKKVNARFLYYDLPPPSPYKTVDTLKAVRRVSANTSNKLDDLGNLYGIGRKVKHQGIDLWLACMAGDRAAWKKMAKYNKQDVLLLEKLYKRILPWIPNHPPMGMLTPNTACPRCGSSKGFHKGGLHLNKTTEYQVWRCKSCRGQARTTLNLRETKPLVGI